MPDTLNDCIRNDFPDRLVASQNCSIVFNKYAGLNKIKFIIIFTVSIMLSGCNFTVPGADQIFGKQDFVSAVALIELHKTRYGMYPESLSDLKYLGEWDTIWLSAVKYKKDGNGYDLYVVRGWVGKPNLVFPEDFKRGLGIKKTNVHWSG